MKQQFLEFTEFPEEHRLNSLGTSVIQIVKAGVGTGILTAPFIYRECGYILAPILLFVCPVLAYYAFSMTLDVIDNVDQNNNRLKLFDAVKMLLGDKYSHILRIINMLYNFGTSTGYVLLIIRTMMALFQLPESFIYKVIFALILGSVYIPLSLNRNLAYITRYSTIAIGVQISIFIIIIINSLTYLHSEGVDEKTYENKNNYWEIPFHFGLIFFLYDMCNVYSDVRNSMRFTSQSRSVLQYYYVITFLIANIMGAATYFAFGENTDEIAFRNIEKGGYFQNMSIFINSAYVLCLIVSMIIFNFTMIMLLEKYVGIEEIDRQKQTYLRMGVFTVQSIIAIFVPSFTALMSFQGSVWTVLILFVFPYLCIKKLAPHYTFIYNRKTQYQIITILGVLAGISGFLSEIL